MKNVHSLESPLCISVQSAAQQLSCSRSTIFRMADQGELVLVGRGGHGYVWKVSVESIVEWMKRYRRPPRKCKVIRRLA